MEVVQYIMANGADMLSAVIALLSGIMAVALMIPGEQPEKALQSIINVLKKLSKK